MSLEKIRVGYELKADQEPAMELEDLLQSYVERAPYAPSDPITLGLYFMLNRGDRPARQPRIVLAARSWLSRGIDFAEKSSIEAYDLWDAEFELHRKDELPNLKFLERAMLLYARLGILGAQERYEVCTRRYREWFRQNTASSRSKSNGET